MVTYELEWEPDRPEIKNLELKMEEKLGQWFQHMPNHCELGCCGFASMYLPEELALKTTSLKQVSEFRDWFVKAIMVLKAHEKEVTYVSSHDFWIEGGEIDRTIAIFAEIVATLTSSSSNSA